MINRTMMVPLAIALGVTVIAVLGVEVFERPAILQIASWLIAMTALPSTVTYLLTRRDFGSRVAAPAAVGCVILMGVGTWFGFVFSYFAFFAAAALYLLLRRSVRYGPALAVSTATLMGGLALSALAMVRALDAMG